MTSPSEALLTELPLLAGVDLSGLTEQLSVIELAPSQELWRQGHAADGLYIVVAGRLRISARLPGGREAALTELGPRSLVGELALLDGGTRTAGARALERTRLLRLGSGDFRALVAGNDPGARAVRRRLLELACARLAARHQALAAMLDGERIRAAPQRGEPTMAPDAAYLSRLPFFARYGRTELAALVARGSVARVAAGTLLVSEGEPSPGLVITLNGAIEETVRRGTSAIRTALLGPGQAFGHVGALIGQPATTDAVARERSVVLVLSAEQLADELGHDDFATAVEHQTVAGLRHAERPQARLAAMGSRASHGAR